MSEKVPNTEDFAIVCDILKSINDPSRLKIFWLLCHRELCVLEIAGEMEMSAPAVSHHLKILKQADLITSSRNGKIVVYRATRSKSVDYLHHMIEELMEISCP